MREIFQEIKKYSLIVIAVTAVLGILLVAFPEQTITYTAVVIGGCFILCGIVALINYGVKRDTKISLVLGTIAVIGGLIICLAYRQIVSVMVFMLGIFLLVGGLLDFFNSIDVAIRHFHSSIFTIILSVASIVIGILSIVNPFDTQNKIVQLIGAGFIVFAVLDLVTYVQVKKVAKIIKDNLEDDGVDAKEVDFKEIDD